MKDNRRIRKDKRIHERMKKREYKTVSRRKKNNEDEYKKEKQWKTKMKKYRKNINLKVKK